MTVVLRPGQRVLHIPGIDFAASRRAVSVPVAGDWWLAGGIPAGNCLEHVELPTIGQAYAGATVARGSQFTIAFRTTDSSATARVLDFNGTESRLSIGYVPQNGFLDSWWWGSVDVPLFTPGDHVYFLVRDATGGQCYRDNAAVGSFYSSFGAGINGAYGARWRSQFDNASVAQWTPDLPAAAVYNIELSSGQRAALYTAMAAL